MSDIIGYKDEGEEVSFNYTLEEMNNLFDKMSNSETYTLNEKNKLASLVNYDDTAVRELIAAEASSRQEAENRLSEEIAALAARVKALEDAQTI